MSVRIIRHFRPSIDCVYSMDSVAFDNWVKLYDDSELIVTKTSDTQYANIVTSSLSRSIRTAEFFVGANIKSLSIFDEVPIKSCFETNCKLPLWLWLALGRLAWLFGHHSQPESFSQTLRRARSAATTLKGCDGDTLVITHGLFMVFLKMFMTSKGVEKCL